MSKKITIAVLSILAILFLTAQTCALPSVSTGQESDCTYDGEILCDEDDSTTALECEYNGYGGFYLSDASDEDDVEYCGAVEAFDEESLARRLITLSSDLENIIDDLNDLKMQGRNAEADGDGRALVMIRAQLQEIRADLADISAVLTAVTADVDDAAAAGEDTTTLDTLVTDAQTELTVAEDLLLLVSTQVTDALAALSSGAGVACTEATETTDCVTGEVCSSSSACEIDSDSDGLGDDTDDICVGYDDTEDNDGDSTPDGCDADADGDELTDSFETAYWVDITVTDGTEDADGDGLTNAEEETAGTSPLVVDSDGDLISDYLEVEAGTDPMDSADYPLCSSSDGEKDYYTTGETIDKSSEITYTEYCITSDWLREYYCVGDTVDYDDVDCAYYGMTCNEDADACGIYPAEVIDVSSASGTVTSTTYFLTYESILASDFVGMGSYIPSTSTYNDIDTGNPASASPLLIAFSRTAVWNGLTAGETISVTTDVSTLTITLPTFAQADLTKTYLLFYVAEDGNLYYAAEDHGGLYSSLTGLLTPEEALTAEHLVS